MPNKVQTTLQLCSFHMPARLYSKSFKLGFSSMWTKNFQTYKQGFEETEEPEIKLPTFVGSWGKQGSSRKISTSASLIIPKPLSVWITTNCRKFLKKEEYQITLPVSWETCMWVNWQELELKVEQLTGSKLGKEYVKAVYCHPLYLTYMQSTSWETLGWMNHKLESNCWEKY